MNRTSKSNNCESIKLALHRLSDDELGTSLKTLVREELRIGVEILDHLKEVERRSLHLRLGYPSLFAYCTKELGYSEGAAGRRISAMRLMKEVPDVRKQIVSGAVTISNASMVQNFFRREKVEQKKTYTPTEKTQLIASISHQSTKECERTLLSISPLSVQKKESQRQLTPEITEVRFQASDELMKKLEHVRGLLAHRKPYAGMSDIIEIMADMVIQKLDPLAPRERRSKKNASEMSAATSTPMAAERRRTSQASTPAERGRTSQASTPMAERGRAHASTPMAERGRTSQASTPMAERGRGAHGAGVATRMPLELLIKSLPNA